MKKKRKFRTDRFVALVLIVAISFFAGRAFGFREAENAYEPVIQKTQSIIDDLREELARFKNEKESSKSDTKSNSGFQASYLIPARMAGFFLLDIKDRFAFVIF